MVGATIGYIPNPFDYDKAIMVDSSARTLTYFDDVQSGSSRRVINKDDHWDFAKALQLADKLQSRTGAAIFIS